MTLFLSSGHEAHNSLPPSSFPLLSNPCIHDRRYSIRGLSERAASRASAFGVDSTAGSPAPLAIERRLWARAEEHKSTPGVEYGVGAPGSAFPPSSGDPLRDRLARSGRSPLRHLGNIQGITVSDLYIATLFGVFTWHVEDAYMGAANYLHSGVKIWNVCPASEAPRLHRVVAGLAAEEEAALAALEDDDFEPDATAPYGLAAKAVIAAERAKARNARMSAAEEAAHVLRAVEDAAAAELARKRTVLSPLLLQRGGVKVHRWEQHAGEMIFVFPRAYHGGTSCDTSVAQASNCSSERWHEHAAAAAECCRRQKTPAVLGHERLLLLDLRDMAEAGDEPLSGTLRVASDLLDVMVKARGALETAGVEEGGGVDLQALEVSRFVDCKRCLAACFGVFAEGTVGGRQVVWCARCVLEQRRALTVGRWRAMVAADDLRELGELVARWRPMAVEEGEEEEEEAGGV